MTNSIQLCYWWVTCHVAIMCKNLHVEFTKVAMMILHRACLSDQKWLWFSSMQCHQQQNHLHSGYYFLFVICKASLCLHYCLELLKFGQVQYSEESGCKMCLVIRWQLRVPPTSSIIRCYYLFVVAVVSLCNAPHFNAVAEMSRPSRSVEVACSL